MSVDDTNARFYVADPGGEKFVEVFVVMEFGRHGSSEMVIHTPAGRLRVPISVHKDRKHPGTVTVE